MQTVLHGRMSKDTYGTTVLSSLRSTDQILETNKQLWENADCPHYYIRK